jgi:hypothetical protein
VYAPDAVVALLGGPFKGYARYADMPPAVRTGPACLQSWAGMELWRWWTPPDVVSADPAHQFHRLSPGYRAAVWTVLLVCERHADSVGRGGTAVPYGEVPVELWMLIFGFYKRSIHRSFHKIHSWLSDDGQMKKDCHICGLSMFGRPEWTRSRWGYDLKCYQKH